MRPGIQSDGHRLHYGAQLVSFEPCHMKRAPLGHMQTVVLLTSIPQYIFVEKKVRGMFEMNCLLSSSSMSTWGTIKTNTYLYRAILYLHNGI